MERKAKKFTKRIAHRLSKAEFPTDSKLHAAFRDGIEQVTNDPLKEELQQNIKFYVKLLKTWMEKLSLSSTPDHDPEPDPDPVPAKKLVFIESGESFSLDQLSHLDKNQRAQICTRCLLKRLKSTHEHGSLLQIFNELQPEICDEKELSWMTVLERLLKAGSVENDSKTLKKILQIYLSKFQPVAESCLSKKSKIKRATSLQKKLRHFLSIFHLLSMEPLKTDQRKDHSLPKKEDILTSLISFYIDLSAQAFSQVEKIKKLSLELGGFIKYILQGEDNECHLEVLLQLSCDKASPLVLPYARSCLEFPMPDPLSCPYYLKYILCCGMLSEELPDIFKSARNIRSPRGFLRWLRGQCPEALREMPEDEKFRGRQITHFLLNDLSEDLQTMLLDALTYYDAVDDDDDVKTDNREDERETKNAEVAGTSGSAKVFFYDKGSKKKGKKKGKKKKAQISKKGLKKQTFEEPMDIEADDTTVGGTEQQQTSDLVEEEGKPGTPDSGKEVEKAVSPGSPEQFFYDRGPKKKGKSGKPDLGKEVETTDTPTSAKGFFYDRGPKEKGEVEELEADVTSKAEKTIQEGNKEEDENEFVTDGILHKTDQDDAVTPGGSGKKKHKVKPGASPQKNLDKTEVKRAPCASPGSPKGITTSRTSKEATESHPAVGTEETVSEMVKPRLPKESNHSEQDTNLENDPLQLDSEVLSVASDTKICKLLERSPSPSKGTTSTRQSERGSQLSKTGGKSKLYLEENDNLVVKIDEKVVSPKSPKKSPKSPKVSVLHKGKLTHQAHSSDHEENTSVSQKESEKSSEADLQETALLSPIFEKSQTDNRVIVDKPDQVVPDSRFDSESEDTLNLITVNSDSEKKFLPDLSIHLDKTKVNESNSVIDLTDCESDMSSVNTGKSPKMTRSPSHLKKAQTATDGTSPLKPVLIDELDWSSENVQAVTVESENSDVEVLFTGIKPESPLKQVLRPDPDSQKPSPSEIKLGGKSELNFIEQKSPVTKKSPVTQKSPVKQKLPMTKDSPVKEKHSVTLGSENSVEEFFTFDVELRSMQKPKRKSVAESDSVPKYSLRASAEGSDASKKTSSTTSYMDSSPEKKYSLRSTRRLSSKAQGSSLGVCTFGSRKANTKVPSVKEDHAYHSKVKTYSKSETDSHHSDQSSKEVIKDSIHLDEKDLQRDIAAADSVDMIVPDPKDKEIMFKVSPEKSPIVRKIPSPPKPSTRQTSVSPKASKRKSCSDSEVPVKRYSLRHR